MRIKPTIFFKYITIIFSIFGVIGFTIAILAGTDFWRAVCAILLFFNGWVAAKIHERL
jgi:hypothetical protein